MTAEEDARQDVLDAVDRLRGPASLLPPVRVQRQYEFERLLDVYVATVSDGFDTGKDEGRQEGCDEGYDEGKNDGLEEGLRTGQETGYEEGRRAGFDEAERGRL